MRAICLGAALTLAPLAASAQTPPDPLAPGAGAAGNATPAAAVVEAEKSDDAPAPRHPRAGAKRESRAGGSFAVTVNNARSVGLVELRVGPAGADLKKEVGALAFGRKTVIHLKRSADCLYDIHAHFADDADTDQSGVDLCKDKSINLTD